MTVNAANRKPAAVNQPAESRNTVEDQPGAMCFEATTSLVGNKTSNQTTAWATTGAWLTL